MGSIPRNRALIVLGLAESVSGIGNWVTMLAIFALLIFRGDGGVAQSSAVFLAGLLPTLTASPLAGWLVDRIDRRRLMIASQVLAGLSVSGLIFVERIEFIYALIALQAVFLSVLMPARQSAVPDLIGPANLTQANAFLQQLASIVKIAAPMLAGLLLTLMDPHTAIILDVVSFFVSAAILTRLPALPPRREPPAVRAPAQGSLHVWESPHLRLLFMGAFFTVLVIIGFDVLSSVLTRDVLQGNEGLYGLLVGLVGLGTAGASLMLLLSRRQRDAWRDMLVGLCLLALLPGSAALATLFNTPAMARFVLAAGCLVGGIGDGLVVVQAATLLQRLSPPAQLGRVGGAFQSTLVGGQLAGILLSPLLVPAVLSIGAYFAVTAALLGLMILYMALKVPGMTRDTRAKGEEEWQNLAA